MSSILELFGVLGFLTHQNTLADITEAIVRLTLPLIHNIHNIQGQLLEFGPIAF